MGPSSAETPEAAPAHPQRRNGESRIRDVARLAGVSAATVSRVLNDSPSVREESKARVMEAIAQLGYRPTGSPATCAARAPR